MSMNNVKLITAKMLLEIDACISGVMGFLDIFPGGTRYSEAIHAYSQTLRGHRNILWALPVLPKLNDGDTWENRLEHTKALSDSLGVGYVGFFAASCRRLDENDTWEARLSLQDIDNDSININLATHCPRLDQDDTWANRLSIVKARTATHSSVYVSDSLARLARYCPRLDQDDTWDTRLKLTGRHTSAARAALAIHCPRLDQNDTWDTRLSMCDDADYRSMLALYCPNLDQNDTWEARLALCSDSSDMSSLALNCPDVKGATLDARLATFDLAASSINKHYLIDPKVVTEFYDSIVIKYT